MHDAFTAHNIISIYSMSVRTFLKAFYIIRYIYYGVIDLTSLISDWFRGQHV